LKIFYFLNSSYHSDLERANITIQALFDDLEDSNWHKISDTIPDQLPENAILICFVDQDEKMQSFLDLIDENLKSKTIIFDLNSDKLLEYAEKNQFLAIVGFDSVTKWHLKFPNNYFKLGVDYGFYGKKAFFNPKKLNTIDIDNFNSPNYCILYSEMKSDISDALLKYLKNSDVIKV
jgi:hypothetical protein